MALRFAGLTLSIAIAAGVFIYLDALGQSALTDRIDRVAANELNITLRGKLSDIGAPGHESLKSAVMSSIGDALDEVTHDPIMAAKSPTLVFNRDEVVWDNARAFLSVVDNVKAAAILTDGAWPKSRSGQVEVAVSQASADYLGVITGDELEVRPAAGISPSFIVRISGVYERTTTYDLVWDAIDVGLGANSQAFRVTPLMVDEEAFASNLGHLMPEGDLRYYWVLEVDTEAVRARNAEVLLDDLDVQATVLRRDIEGFQRVTTLPRVLENHLSAVSISVALMLAVGFVLAASGISFAALVAAKARDLRESESGMMHARGSTAQQDLFLMAGENVTVALASLLAGPILALWFVTISGRLTGLNNLTGGTNLPGSLTIEAVLVAVATCTLGVITMTLPSLSASTQHAIVRLARPKRLTVMQRYYLDLPILALALIGIWQLSQGELHFVSNAFGTGFIRHLEFVMPAAFALAVALVVLRLMPLTMSIVSDIVSLIPKWARISPSVTLGLWTLARNPGSNFGLMLLAMLSVCLAFLGSVLGPSLEAHSEDAARYLVGADVRVSNMSVRSQGALARQVEQIRELESVNTVSQAVRAVGTVNPQALTEAVAVLGVDPETFPSVVNWRDDFGDVQVQPMMRALESGDGSGIPIPPDTVMLTALVKPDLRRADVALTVRLRGASGRYHTLTIGTLTPRSITLPAMEMFPCEDAGLSHSGEPLPPEDWCRIGAPLTAAQLDEEEMSDLTLQFVGISRRPSEEPLQLGIGAVAISDLSAIATDGTVSVLTNWENIRQQRTPGGGFGDLGARIDPVSSLGGDGALLTWSQPSWHDLKGVAIGDQTPVVNVIAGRWFNESLGMQIDDEMRLYMGSREVQVVFRGFTDFFPTFGSAKSPYLIADLQEARDILIINDPSSADSVNELWIDLVDDDTDALHNVGALVSNALSAPPTVQGTWLERSRFAADPLAYAGWSSFLTFGLASVVAVTSLAFVVTGWTTYKLRSLEFAVLRSMGMTDRQWVSLIALEQTIPPLVATAVGIGIGVALSSVLLPYIAGQDPEMLAPPMRVAMNWERLGTVLLLFGGALTISIVTVIVWTRRQQINLVLRAGGGIG